MTAPKTREQAAEEYAEKKWAHPHCGGYVRIEQKYARLDFLAGWVACEAKQAERIGELQRKLNSALAENSAFIRLNCELREKIRVAIRWLDAIEHCSYKCHNDDCGAPGLAHRALNALAALEPRDG